MKEQVAAMSRVFGGVETKARQAKIHGFRWIVMVHERA